MEKLSKDLIVTLDNNESYFVASTTYYEEELFGLLINVNKDDDYMIVKSSNDNIEKINNEETLKNIYPLLNEKF